MWTTKGSRWLVPLVCLLVGGAYLAVGWVGGRPGLGVAMAGVMVGYGAILMLGGREEVFKVLRGQPTDEMWRELNARALLLSGLVLYAVLVGLGLCEIARGGDGQPYALIVLAGGIGYFAALVWFRLRP